MRFVRQEILKEIKYEKEYYFLRVAFIRAVGCMW